MLDAMLRSEAPRVLDLGMAGPCPGPCATGAAVYRPSSHAPRPASQAKIFAEMCLGAGLFSKQCISFSVLDNCPIIAAGRTGNFSFIEMPRRPGSARPGGRPQSALSDVQIAAGDVAVFGGDAGVPLFPPTRRLAGPRGDFLFASRQLKQARRASSSAAGPKKTRWWRQSFTATARGTRPSLANCWGVKGRRSCSWDTRRTAGSRQPAGTSATQP